MPTTSPPTPGDGPAPGDGRRPARRGYGVWVLVGLALVAGLAAWQLPLVRWGLSGIAALRAAGAVGVALYGAVYVSATILMVPGSLLTIGAGMVYGLVGGFAIVWPASVAGAVAAFVIGRWLARGWVTDKVRTRPLLRAIDGAIGARGFAMILLLRLSPLIPFSFSNYVYGVSRVRLRDYVAATTIGMVPGILLFVFLGTTVTDAAALASGTTPEGGAAGQALFYGGLLATLVATGWISRLAGRQLQARLGEPAVGAPLAARGAQDADAAGNERDG